MALYIRRAHDHTIVLCEASAMLYDRKKESPPLSPSRLEQRLHNGVVRGVGDVLHQQRVRPLARQQRC